MVEAEMGKEGRKGSRPFQGGCVEKKSFSTPKKLFCCSREGTLQCSEGWKNDKGKQTGKNARWGKSDGFARSRALEKNQKYAKIGRSSEQARRKRGKPKNFGQGEGAVLSPEKSYQAKQRREEKVSDTLNL